MEKFIIKLQTPADETWIDETGFPVPVTRIRKSERNREKLAHTLAKKAFDLHLQLAAFKKHITDVCQKVYIEVMIENDVKKLGKGCFTWYNTAQTIKIEVAIHDNIAFDDILIAACKAKFDELLSKNLSGVDEMFRAMVSDAFHNTKGQLDSKKLLSLFRHKGKVKDSLFNEALDLLAKSIRRPDQKKYIRVFVKDEQGEYENINLNFSSI